MPLKENFYLNKIKSMIMKDPTKDEVELLLYFIKKNKKEKKYEQQNILELRPNDTRLRNIASMKSNNFQINKKKHPLHDIFENTNISHNKNLLKNNFKCNFKRSERIQNDYADEKNAKNNLDSKISKDLKNIYECCKESGSLKILKNKSNIDKFMKELNYLGFLNRKKRKIGKSLEEKRKSHIECELHRKRAINSALLAISDFLPIPMKLNTKRIVFLALEKIFELHNENFLLKK
ncbi:hypothetical protein DMUE_1833 [Dictyocoela muelleri]|nr:hypothetical protein DMUE_1833 [Dictyocoela muelleri]